MLAKTKMMMYPHPPHEHDDSEYEFEGDEDSDDYDESAPDDGDVHGTPGSIPSGSEHPSSLLRRKASKSRVSRPKKLHKFFDSQPRGSRTLVPTVTPSPLQPQSNAVGTASPKGLPSSGSSIDAKKGGLGLVLLLDDSEAASSRSTAPYPSREPPTDSQPLPNSQIQPPPLIPRFDSSSSIGVGAERKARRKQRPRVLRVPEEDVVESAHYGYIYCMSLVRPHVDSRIGVKEEEGIEGRGEERKRGRRDSRSGRPPFGSYEPAHRFREDVWSEGEVRLVTGSGDEDVKVRLGLLPFILYEKRADGRV